MKARTVVLVCSQLLIVAGQTLFIVAVSLPRWAEFDSGNSGLFNFCYDGKCESIPIVAGIAFIDATRLLGLLTFVVMAIGIVAEFVMWCCPPYEGDSGYVVKMRLKEICSGIAGLLALGTGIAYACRFEDHYDQYEPEWGASLIMVFVSAGILMIGAIVMYEAKIVKKKNKVGTEDDLSNADYSRTSQVAPPYHENKNFVTNSSAAQPTSDRWGMWGKRSAPTSNPNHAGYTVPVYSMHGQSQ